MKEKLKTVYVIFVWAVCALILFQTLGNYLIYCAFRLDYRTKCWLTAYRHAIDAPFDFQARK